ncbi:MAG: class I SAM-dependent methyltransferase [Desulfonatronovibrio sp.]
MFDSEKTAREYDHWFKTEAGQFAFNQEKRLIQHLISSWPRKKQRLLDIGCGTGVFLELFWEAGFDVYGIDASATMLSRARERMGTKADLHLGKAQYLPFDDNEFDFSAIVTVLEFCAEPEKVLLEAARVTKKGILVCFLNRNSLYYLSKKLARSGRTGLTSNARWFTHKEIKNMVADNMGPKNIFSLSVLPGSRFMWKDRSMLKYINQIFWPPCLGSFVAMRVEILEMAPIMTPLMAFKKA